MLTDRVLNRLHQEIAKLAQGALKRPEPDYASYMRLVGLHEGLNRALAIMLAEINGEEEELNSGRR